LWQIYDITLRTRRGKLTPRGTQWRDMLNFSSVVFSYWTYTLDLIQAMLDDNGILYTRIDGKKSLPKRAQALRSFEKDKSLRVMLVSITCGGAG